MIRLFGRFLRPASCCGVLMVVTLALFDIAVPSRAATSPCVGDCTADSAVTVEEVLVLVNIALGAATVDACHAGDANGDQTITVEEIVAAVNAVLNGCVAGPPDVNGHWAGTVMISDTITQDFTFDLVQDGNMVTGEYASVSEEGTLSGIWTGGNSFSFMLTETTPGCPGSFAGTTTVTGDSMVFSYAGTNCAGHVTAQGTAERIHFCSAPEAVNCCGNNVKEGHETCDGTATPTCQDLGFEGGQTECSDCLLNQRNCFSG